MGITLHAGSPDADAFAAFGTFIDQPAHVGARRDYADWIAPVSGLGPSIYTNRVSPATLPLTLARVERHPHAAQMFLPLVVSRYLVVVMPALAAGRPDASAARAFVLPSTLGVAYRPGVWHAGITALDGEASFAVLMWRGVADDDVFAEVSPIVIADGGLPS
jgi:ureidoglycolate lyase